MEEGVMNQRIQAISRNKEMYPPLNLQKEYNPVDTLILGILTSTTVNVSFKPPNSW